MVRIGIIIICVAIIASIGLAISYYIAYQPNFIEVNSGEPVQVGPVKYIVEHIGEHNGNEETRPEHVFFQIQITVENLSAEKTRINGGQFYILNEDDDKIQPVYGNFSENDLLNNFLEPHEQVLYTTQFDFEYDETKRYRVGILPTKQQASVDIGIICVTNC